jgi:hypothetical protein
MVITDTVARVGHDFHYTVPGRQLTYPLRCNTQHKHLPQQLRLFQIYTEVSTEVGIKSKCNKISRMRCDCVTVTLSHFKYGYVLSY